MGKIMVNGVDYSSGGGDNSIYCTLAEYTAWEQAGTLIQDYKYYITDSNPGSVIDDTTEGTGTTWSSSKIVDMIYPVGSIFISVNNVNPSTYFTGTTWEAFASGRTLVGVDASDTDFDTVEETGGEKSHILTEAQLPKVSGGFYLHGASNGTIVYGIYGNATGTKVDGKYSTCYAQSGAYSYTSPGFAFGNDEAHNNLQPYITTYMWKRTL